MSAGLDTNAVEQASEADRLWFETHPGRSYRIRSPIPGEGPDLPDRPGDGRWLIAVRQIQPGVRVRSAIHMTRMPADTEAVASSVFRRAMRGAA